LEYGGVGLRVFYGYCLESVGEKLRNMVIVIVVVVQLEFPVYPIGLEGVLSKNRRGETQRTAAGKPWK